MYCTGLAWRDFFPVSSPRKRPLRSTPCRPSHDAQTTTFPHWLCSPRLYCVCVFEPLLRVHSQAIPAKPLIRIPFLTTSKRLSQVVEPKVMLEALSTIATDDVITYDTGRTLAAQLRQPNRPLKMHLLPQTANQELSFDPWHPGWSPIRAHGAPARAQPASQGPPERAQNNS